MIPLARRSLEPEIMDGYQPPQDVVDEVYRVLALINTLLGGTRATLRRFSALSRRWRPEAQIDILDVACGRGDVAAELVRWGRARGFRIRVTALDISHRALLSGLASSHPDGLTFVEGDVHAAPFPDRAFDYVISTLFFHHLTDDDVVKTLRSFDRLARRGVVVNDLVRGWRAYGWSKLATCPFNEILRHDGPLSVCKSFRPDELVALARRAGLPWLTVRRHFGHRMTLAGERPV